MSEILVELAKPTDDGRLYFFRDPEVESHLFYIESSPRRQSTYSLVVAEGPVILKFDSQRLLNHVEFIVSRKAWRMTPHLEVPQPASSADLHWAGTQLTDHTSLSSRRPRQSGDRSLSVYQVDDVPVTVDTDDQYDHVQVLFGVREELGKWVALSEQCSALVVDNRLKGFFVTLAGAPVKVYIQQPGG